MEMRVMTDRGERTLNLKPIKGRHATKGINFLLELAKGGTEEVDTDKLKEFLKFVNDTAAELSGLGMEAFEDLDIIEQNKILGYYQEQMQGRLDFMKSSLSVPSSAPKTSPA